MISAQQLLDLIPANAKSVKFHTVFHYNAYLDNSCYPVYENSSVTSVIIALLDKLVGNYTISKIKLPDDVVAILELDKAIQSTNLFNPLLDELKRITPINKQRAVLGSTTARELQQQRTLAKTPTVPAPIDEFSTASFLAWCKSNKLTSPIIYKLLNHNRFTSEQATLLWNSANKKSMKLANTLNIKCAARIDYFTIGHANCRSNYQSPRVLADYNYSNTFTIYRELPKSSWETYEIHLCIAYLTLPDIPEWLPYWIIDNCPIESSHLAQQHQPITTERLNDYY